MIIIRARFCCCLLKFSLYRHLNCLLILLNCFIRSTYYGSNPLEEPSGSKAEKDLRNLFRSACRGRPTYYGLVVRRCRHARLLKACGHGAAALGTEAAAIGSYFTRCATAFLASLYSFQRWMGLHLGSYSADRSSSLTAGKGFPCCSSRSPHAYERETRKHGLLSYELSRVTMLIMAGRAVVSWRAWVVVLRYG